MYKEAIKQARDAYTVVKKAMSAVGRCKLTKSLYGSWNGGSFSAVNELSDNVENFIAYLLVTGVGAKYSELKSLSPNGLSTIKKITCSGDTNDALTIVEDLARFDALTDGWFSSSPPPFISLYFESADGLKKAGLFDNGECIIDMYKSIGEAVLIADGETEERKRALEDYLKVVKNGIEIYTLGAQPVHLPLDEALADIKAADGWGGKKYAGDAFDTTVRETLLYLSNFEPDVNDDMYAVYCEITRAIGREPVGKDEYFAGVSEVAGRKDFRWTKPPYSDNDVTRIMEKAAHAFIRAVGYTSAVCRECNWYISLAYNHSNRWAGIPV